MIRRSLAAPTVITATGLAHFAIPGYFDPINRELGFHENTRRHVYLNGAVETSIGLLSAGAGTRRISIALGAVYGLYLFGHAVHARTIAMQA